MDGIKATAAGFGHHRVHAVALRALPSGAAAPAPAGVVKPGTLRAGSGAWMEPFMNLPEAGPTDVRVDLRGGDVGMPQHELHGAKICPVF